MLIPSIDLQGGRIVQLVQGERLALASDDIDGWIERFRGRPAVQLIDLDAAKDEGSNAALVRRICEQLPCRVGGGVRTIARAREVLDGGATHVIAGSAFFKQDGVDLTFAAALAAAIGAERIIAAVDSRGGQVTTHGWRVKVAMTAVDAVRALEPYVAGFLYTHVDREGLMQGTDIAAITAVASATSRRVAAAGGISTMDEINELDARGIDAVVGMALYTGRLSGVKPGG